jgi:two-component system, sensor histidine kinase LadS
LQQLAQSEASERELLRLAAHEFRTPAAIVKASVDSLALLDKDLPPEVVRRHHNIRLAVDRMTDLAGKLITRDRFQNAATAPQKELLSLSVLVENAVSHYPPETPLRLTLTEAALAPVAAWPRGWA